MTSKEAYKVAEEIVNVIARNSSAECCTWGQNFPEAYEALFGESGYKKDMIEDIVGILT